VYEVRRARCRPARKLIEGSATHRFAHDHLVHRRWSPEQIAQRLRLMNPDDPAARVSHETIYAAICAQPGGGLKTAMILALRQHKPKRGRSRTTLAGGSIAPESLRIIQRPEEVEARLVPGHCGMRRDRGRRCGRVSPPNDLIKGAFNRSAVGTVVERKTRFLLLSKIRGCTADAALEGFTRQMKRLPPCCAKA